MLDMPATVQSVTDGDTVKVIAQPWPGMSIETGVRVRGVDTPELRGACPAEIDAAKRAKEATRRFLESGGERIRLLNVWHDKYGRRVVADIVVSDNHNLAEWLIENGLGRPYDGGKRAGWCDEDDEPKKQEE